MKIQMFILDGLQFLVVNLVQLDYYSVHLLKKIMLYFRCALELFQFCLNLFHIYLFHQYFRSYFKQRNKTLILAQTNQRHFQILAISQILIKCTKITKLILNLSNSHLITNPFHLIFRIIKIHHSQLNFHLINIEIVHSSLNQF